jgi:hypothetical protein
VPRIFPYSSPLQLAPDLWQVTGSFGMPGVPRNMTVVRTEQGELILYSVIAMHEEGMRMLEALGRPTVMVIPHRRHQMDAPFYKQRYPGLRVLAADAARVAGVSVDGPLSELGRFGIESYVLPGNVQEDAVMDVPIDTGRALCVCETLNNISASGFLSLLLQVIGPPGGGFGVPRAVRWREVRDRAALRTWLQTQSERTDLRYLLFGHGAPIASDIPGSLRRAASGA